MPVTFGKLTVCSVFIRERFVYLIFCAYWRTCCFSVFQEAELVLLCLLEIMLLFCVFFLRELIFIFFVYVFVFYFSVTFRKMFLFLAFLCYFGNFCFGFLCPSRNLLFFISLWIQEAAFSLFPIFLENFCFSCSGGTATTNYKF